MDESGAWLGMLRSYARSSEGTRAVSNAPKRRKGKVSLIAAITLQGLDSEPCLIQPGAADTKAFLIYLRDLFAPTLRPGQVVFTDNFTIHYNKDVRRLVENVGCYLAYLPTYSPDYILDKTAPSGPVRNPVELVFAKL